MKLGRKIRLVVLLAMMTLSIAPGFPEGPLFVGGPLDNEGVPYRWNPANFPLTYWTDLGNLGSQSNSAADGFVNQAFTAWQNITTASITFNAAGELGGDVTGANYLNVENSILDCSTLPGNPSGGIARPRTIIYDTDGSIIDEVFGAGQSDFTLGFATGACLTSDGFENSYNRGYAVMNGKGNPSQSELRAVMVHEFGHMLGLDHSQVNVECAFLGCGDADSTAGLPTMFPVLVDVTAMLSLSTDDIAGISELYPETVNDPPNGRVPFASTTGRITGRIFFSDGVTQAQSFNVIARRVDDTLTVTDESRTTAVSNTSGFLFVADNGNPLVQAPGFSPSPFGSRDTNFAGYFEIPGLPPGNYTLEVEAIDSSFSAGSGVGPLGALSVVFPMPSPTCPDGEFFDFGESDVDVCATSDAVSVGANTTIPDRDIILNSTPPLYDAWEDGP